MIELEKSDLPLFEIARVHVRFRHVASFIINANHSVASDLQAIGKDPQRFNAFVNAAATRKNEARASQLALRMTEPVY
jgi:hypothetical protein